MTKISLQLLGQSGCRIEYDGVVIYMDPYLSNSVQELDASDLERLIPVPMLPESVTDADWVIITHEHIDHCDPHTLPMIAEASPNCRIIGPPPVLNRLSDWGIAAHRCQVAKEQWMQLNDTIALIALPAAHPDIRRDERGYLLTVGYIMEINGGRIYLAGDTSVKEELIESLMSFMPITTALLPVNEHNFYRGRRGIVGNMSIRDAFSLANEIGIKTVIPVHWDMFAANCVSPDEIKATYQQVMPCFDLQINPTSIVL